MSKNNKRNRTKTHAKPKFAFYEKGNIQILAKNINAKHHLTPLTQKQKDENYPGLDTRSTKKVAKGLNLNAEWDIIPLSETETDRKRKATLSGRKKSKRGKKRAKRIFRFFSLPEAMRDKKTGYLILFAAMLACLQGFLPEGLPMVQSLHLGTPLVVPSALLIVLKAVNGPKKVRDINYTLQRPFFLTPKRDSVSSSAPSSSPYTYFGGKLKGTTHRGRKFWLPLWNCAVVIGQGLPATIRSIAADAPSVIPIFCDGTKKDSRGLELDVDGLTVEDEDLLCSIKKHTLIVNAIFRNFLLHLKKSPLRSKAIFNDVSNYIPERHIKGGGAYHPSLEDYLVAEGLCVYGALLDYIRKQKLMPKKKCKELFKTARACLLSDERGDELQNTGTAIGNWRDKGTFMPFFEAYLRNNITLINFNGTPCLSDAVAAVHMLGGKKKDKKQLLVAPYKATLIAYRLFLSEYGVEADWTDASFYRAAQTWSIKGFKEGSRHGKDPWKHNFYQDDDLPDGVTNPNVNCFGFPVEELPDEIKQFITGLQAARNVDSQKEANKNA